MADISAPVFNAEGKQVAKQPLNASIFGVAFKDAIVHEAVRAHQANRRQVLAHTKTRAEVRGGGKKPWRQKGTGRARVGSIRSPLWIGGGIIFGPRKDRNFSLKINKKVRQQALRMSLSDKVASGHLLVVDEWKLGEARTKQLAKLLQALPSKGKKTLLITVPQEQTVIQAARNLPNVASINAGSLNTYDVLNSDFLVVAKNSIPLIENRYGA